MKTKWFRIRQSSIHGKGAYAAKPIPRGTDVVEYAGERVSLSEADRRYEESADGDARFVLLFQIDDDVVIDAGVGGNDGRFVNHSCEPNCESVLVGTRVFIRAVRKIAPDEELTYDYKLRHEDGDGPEVAGRFPCRCGAASCRGTLLARRKRTRKGRKTASRR